VVQITLSLASLSPANFTSNELNQLEVIAAIAVAAGNIGTSKIGLTNISVQSSSNKSGITFDFRISAADQAPATAFVAKLTSQSLNAAF
jgi:hypothetical protein